MDKKKSILKQRAILGIILLCGAALITWAGRTLYSPGGSYTDFFGIPISRQGTTAEQLPSNIIGINDIIFTPPAKLATSPLPRRSLTPLTAEYIERLSNFNYLTNQIFLVDPETILLPTDISIPTALAADFTIDNTIEGPRVLVFHAHSNERFVDSDLSDPMCSIMGVGQHLARILAEVHGIETLHYTGQFDIVDGRPRVSGSYERMEPVIRQVLADNPSIQMVIDLHRDGVSDHVPALYRYVDGTRTAQIMFFNGLSRQNRNGQPVPVEWLYNPYQQENLHFSLRLQLAANQLYPGLARRIYLRAFRYSLHMMPMSTLVEVGNQHNLTQDAMNAMYPLANIVAAVVLGG